MNRRGMLLLAAAVPLAAHDDKLHRATFGEVQAVQAAGFTFKTRTGTITVKYSSRTRFERGGKPAGKAEVRAGERAAVLGAKLPDGSLMAHTVVLGAVPDSSSKGHKH